RVVRAVTQKLRGDRRSREGVEEEEDEEDPARDREPVAPQPPPGAFPIASGAYAADEIACGGVALEPACDDRRFDGYRPGRGGLERRVGRVERIHRTDPSTVARSRAPGRLAHGGRRWKRSPWDHHRRARDPVVHDPVRGRALADLLEPEEEELRADAR